MIVFPAIDVSGGKCVRLTQGDFDSLKVYNHDPLQTFQRFFLGDAKWAHIVDLDGTKGGQFSQYELLKTLVNTNLLRIQVGGGLHLWDQVDTLLRSVRVNRVVLGSVSVTRKEPVNEWIDEFGPERIVLALDCKYNSDDEPIVQIKGWQQDSGESVWDVLAHYPFVKYVLCTDISVDGTLNGPNLGLYRELKRRFPEIQVIASGGVSSYDDLKALEEVGVYGAVLGKAMYEGKVELKQAMALMGREC
jgi:phosphoribosylformimino-5-aminoimidazole carboxamide ribotide isomerase